MAYINTVAIIGATTTVGSLIAKSIVPNYRLLLMDTAHPQLVLVQNEILAIDEDAEVDVIHCSKDATWEADVIVVANGVTGIEELAIKMEQVSNCKTVLHFISQVDDMDKLQQLLPHAKVISILSSQPFTDANVDAIFRGTDKEAMDTAKKIVAAMTCQP